MIPIRMPRRFPLATLAVLTFAVVAARPAAAAGPTMSECLSANDSSIKLRSDHKLRRARDQALVCAASSCPGEVRDTCQLRIKDINAAIPSIVFVAKDRGGHDVVAVNLSMDGEPMGDHLDGTALAIDPGLHTFTFQVSGQPPVQQSFVISEGQKDRRETILLGGASIAAPPPALPNAASRVGAPTVPGAVPSVTTGAPPSASLTAMGEAPVPASVPGSGQRLAGIVVGAAGVVGLGLGAVFGALASSDWSKAKSICNGQPLSCTTDPNSPGVQDENSASTMATLSTVSFIAGGALAAGGFVVFLTAPKASSSGPGASGRGVELLPTGGAGGAGMLVRGWF